MSRSVKYNVSLRRKVPEKYRRGGNHRRYYEWEVLMRKRKQMDKDLFTLWDDPFNMEEILWKMWDKIFEEEIYGYS